MLEKFVYCFVVNRFGEDFLRFGGFGTSDHPKAIKYMQLDYILNLVDSLSPKIGFEDNKNLIEE